MIDKCRRKMNGIEEYITREITQKGGGIARRKGEAQRGGRGSRDARGVGDSSPRVRWSVLPGPFGPSDPVHFSFPPLQNEPLPYQSPTSGPILYKFIVMGSIRKP